MPIDRIITASIQDGAVIPADLSTGAPSWDTSGNVGIGTTSPSARLDVVGDGLFQNPSGNRNIVIRSSSGNGSFISLASNGNAGFTNSFDIFQSSNGDGSLNNKNGPIIFLTGTGNTSAERARIDSSGRLLVGTTSAPGQTGGVIVANNELFVYNIPTTASGANCNISSGESNRFYRSTSALKYKQDIRDIESIDIGKFRPVRYKSKCENDDQTKDHFGIIADEVAAEGIEELVTRGADGEIEGFQYDRLTVVLLKTVQEQQQMIETLQAKVAALEAK